MAHTHDVYDMENHFEINGSSRFIKETSETKLVVVQGDHKSEVLTFKMPRYIDGHDMTLCNKIRIHYINLDTKTNNKSADVYEVTDLTLCEECEDVLTFTWTIEAPATKYSGTLSFLVKFECTEGENVLYQWNTAKYVSVNVLAGIDNSEEFVEKYSNVLEEWYNELTKGADSIEELNQQAIAEIELAKEDAKEDIQGKANSTMAVMNQFSSNAYNSFKNDVDKKATRTLESIPEDYSDLDAEVKDQAYLDGINGDFIEGKIKDIKPIVYQGKYVSNNEEKTYSSESTGGVTDFIPLQPNKLAIYNTNYSNMGYVYDKDKNCIGRLTKTDGEMKSIMPENGYFIRVHYSGADSSVLDIKVQTDNVTHHSGLRLVAENLTDEFTKQFENTFVPKIHTSQMISHEVDGMIVKQNFTVEQGKYVQGDVIKEYLTADIGGVTGFIRVYENKKVKYKSYRSAGSMYDIRKNYVGDLQSPTSENTMAEIEITVPKGVAYIRVNYSGADSNACEVYVETDNNAEYETLQLVGENITDIFAEKLKTFGANLYKTRIIKPTNFGESLVAFGDSITYGIASPNAIKITDCYIKLTCEALGLTLDNRAISGTCICDSESIGSIYNKVMAYTGGHDTVLIAGGCNDFNFGKPLGAYGDVRNDTFYGCLYQMCEHLKSIETIKHVVFITPINQTVPVTTENAISFNNNPYRNAIYEVASSYPFSIVNGEDMNFPFEQGAYSEYMIVDGVHPTVNGHKMYAENLISILS